MRQIEQLVGNGMQKRVREQLTRVLQRKVLGMLVRMGKLSAEERDRMLRWKHTGFSIDTSVRIKEGRRAELERLLCYIRRHTFRMWGLSYNPENRVVLYQAGKMNGLKKQNFVTFKEPIEAIEALRCCLTRKLPLSLPTDPKSLPPGLQILQSVPRKRVLSLPCGARSSDLVYFAQEPTQPNHYQDIAIRRALLRLETWFQGSQWLEVRGMRSQGYVLHPGLVRFHRPEAIREPVWEGVGSLPGSIESFWQSNKVVLAPRSVVCGSRDVTSLLGSGAEVLIRAGAPSKETGSSK